jgi:hypothetical protein
MAFTFTFNCLQLSEQTTTDGTSVLLMAGPQSQWNLSYQADTFSEALSGFNNDISAAITTNQPLTAMTTTEPVSGA